MVFYLKNLIRKLTRVLTLNKHSKNVSAYIQKLERDISEHDKRMENFALIVLLPMTVTSWGISNSFIRLPLLLVAFYVFAILAQNPAAKKGSFPERWRRGRWEVEQYDDSQLKDALLYKYHKLEKRLSIAGMFRDKPIFTISFLAYIITFSLSLLIW